MCLRIKFYVFEMPVRPNGKFPPSDICSSDGSRERLSTPNNRTSAAVAVVWFALSICRINGSWKISPLYFPGLCFPLGSFVPSSLSLCHYRLIRFNIPFRLCAFSTFQRFVLFFSFVLLYRGLDYQEKINNNKKRKNHINNERKKDASYTEPPVFSFTNAPPPNFHS